MSSTITARKQKARIAELEADIQRLKKGEVFLQMIRDGNSFAYSAQQGGVSE
jgi:hypothetical protein